MSVQPRAVQHNTVAMKCRLCSIHFSPHYIESLKREDQKLYWGNVNFLKVSAMNALLSQSILATFIGRCERNVVQATCASYSWASVSFVYVIIRRLAFTCGRKSKYVCARTVKQNDILRGQKTLAKSASCHLTVGSAPNTFNPRPHVSLNFNTVSINLLQQVSDMKYRVFFFLSLSKTVLPHRMPASAAISRGIRRCQTHERRKRLHPGVAQCLQFYLPVDTPVPFRHVSP